MHSAIPGLGQAYLYLSGRTFLEHGSNSGWMLFLMPPTTYIDLSEYQTKDAISSALTMASQQFTARMKDLDLCNEITAMTKLKNSAVIVYRLR